MQQGLLFGLSIANVLLSAGLQFVPLAFFGAGLTVDSFVAGLMLPSVVASVSAVVVTYSLVPQLAGLDPHQQGALTRRAFGAVTKFLGLPTVALIVFASVWVPWTVPGFPVTEVATTVELARVSLAASLAGVYALVLSVRMQANSEFVLNALVSVLAAAVATGFAVIAIGSLGIVAAAWSLVLKSLLQSAISWVLRPPRILERFGPDVFVVRTAGPLLASSSISKLEPLVDRSLLTIAPPGLLTLFYLAQQIYAALSQVAAGSVLAHVLTRFSTEARHKNGIPTWRSLTSELRRAANVAIGLGILLAGGFLSATFVATHLCPSCATLLKGLELNDLGMLLAALSGVWFFGLQGMVLSSFFYAHGDTMTPSVVAIAGFLVAIGLKLVGFRMGGAVGLAIANSLYFFSTAAAMYVLIRLRHDRGANA
jgi:putative peptidoglycan lipid II flippase